MRHDVLGSPSTASGRRRRGSPRASPCGSKSVACRPVIGVGDGSGVGGRRRARGAGLVVVGLGAQRRPAAAEVERDATATSSSSTSRDQRGQPQPVAARDLLAGVGRARRRPASPLPVERPWSQGQYSSPPAATTGAGVRARVARPSRASGANSGRSGGSSNGGGGGAGSSRARSQETSSFSSSKIGSPAWVGTSVDRVGSRLRLGARSGSGSSGSGGGAQVVRVAAGPGSRARRAATTVSCLSPGCRPRSPRPSPVGSPTKSAR